jgi:KUP system potassium uptake protein
VIASQAVISGAYSLAQQAYQMGYLPRLVLRHTSELERGQIYLPTITWCLYVGVVLLVIGFENSSNLASAYGIAVTGTMLSTSLLYLFAAKRTLQWPMVSVISIVLVFVNIDMMFLLSNLTKILEGGWLPLLVGLSLFVLMSTWRKGRLALINSVYPSKIALDALVSDIEKMEKLPGLAVFLSEPGEGVPNALIKSLYHYRRVHERLVILTVEPTEAPLEEGHSRFMVRDIGEGVQKVIIRFGYMQEQNIPASINEMEALGLLAPINDFSGYYFSRIRPRVGSIPEVPIWREFIFLFMLKNSSRAPDFFCIPSDQVVEFNMHI